MNVIITCARHFEGETTDEIKELLSELGDENPQISMTEFSGILYVDTSANPLDLIKKIREKLEDEPWSIRYTMRAIPIFSVTKTNVIEIVDAVIKQSEKIEQNQTYRITIEKRNSGISSGEIINQIASKILNKVSLEKYDWIILVEVLGAITGVSVIKEEDILSIQREKRGSLE
ncbi:MAG: RNA methyltransferase [Thaumarchaeota archaeon]|nr:RNA methyltransferase [Nitrososphaerota archaeon]